MNKNLILNKIKEVKEDKESIIVLKGFSKSIIGEEDVNIEDIQRNKRKYLQKFLSENPIVSYEEFLLFRSNILELFERIYILDNNLYNKIYPLNAIIPKEKLKYLQEYFNLEYEIELESFKYLDDIDNYFIVYGDYKHINNKDYIVYTNSVLDSHEKIKYINVFSNEKDLINRSLKDRDQIIEIVEESDYIELLSKLDKNKKYFIKTPSMDLKVYMAKLKLINYYYKDIDIYFGQPKKEEKIIKKYDEYLYILKRHWGVDNFFKIPNYDLELLEEGIKETNDVSQAEIIDSIVLETEKSINNKLFTDIFVTAPTGSGKSVMFQIPSIYLGEKYNLMTIVISPLIGLMNDQVKGLEKREYEYGRTIHSDISPVKKQEIMDEIEEGKCHILYISPETLLSRSDVSQLIGNRKIGLFVIDEAHIVTTWGKQFRPDYWFLGDHVKKMRKKQEKDYGHSFPIATFTATAIYGGVEDMYGETKDSLYMPNPITYLGYVKRDNIDIKIKEVEVVRNREEYQLDKFESILKNINREIFQERKTLVYFPTVKLINSFLDYLISNNRGQMTAKYHGQMSKAEKQENYEMFYAGEKQVMLATKAFGMGIDIDDILTIIHFAPTGNVCDYVQEIGRAARKEHLIGKAYYEFMSNDFKYINRFHGISVIKKYQLVQVIEKIHDLFIAQIKNNNENNNRKNQSMLLDAESFSHIFQNDFFDENDAINKVKTSMLIIQKDFENKLGYSPIYMRPIPIFATGYFQINDEKILKEIMQEYQECCKIKDKSKNIIDLNLGYIWKREYKNYTFPYFKYLLYSKSEDLEFKYKDDIIQALIVDIEFENEYEYNFNTNIFILEDIIYNAVKTNKYYSEESLANLVSKELKINKYRSSIMLDSFLTTMKYFSREYSQRIFGRMYNVRESSKNKITYQFKNKISEYFKWIRDNYKKLSQEIIESKLYIINDKNNDNMREVLLFLGLMESFDFLNFRSLGGSNSQIYIHINQTQHLKSIIENPYRYRNNVLTIVDDRHKASVAMLSYLFSGNMDSDKIWEHLENYFLGILPIEVKEKLKESSHDFKT